MSINGRFSIKPIGALSLMLLTFFVFGQVASAYTCTVTDDKSNTKCKVVFSNPKKSNNKAYSSTTVTCDKKANIKIWMELKQLTLLTGWSLVNKDDTTTPYGTFAFVDVAAGCRYGTYSNWKGYTQVMINGRSALKLETAGSGGNSLPCSI